MFYKVGLRGPIFCPTFEINLLLFLGNYEKVEPSRPNILKKLARDDTVAYFAAALVTKKVL
jgi:hypothetical protein